jgi:hypothetical protein
MKILGVGVVVGAAAPLALAGPEWTETSDAGSLPSLSQSVSGMGALTGIRGELGGAGSPRGTGDFEDVYEIVIKEPALFQAVVSLDAITPVSFDTRLWLFGPGGRGLLANDDASFSPVMGGSALEGAATDMSGSMLISPGRYFLAITGANNVALDVNGDPIFVFGTAGEISGPDGSPLPIAGWSGGGPVGEYLITLEGASFVPAPGAAALLSVAGLAALRRRR